jgi:hypothetical protein
MKITITWPGKQATDPRHSVTLVEPGTPWPMRFYYVIWMDDADPGFYELVNVGFELGYSFDRPEDRERKPGETAPIDGNELLRIGASFATYERLAREALRLEWDAADTTAAALRRVQRPTRKVDDAFLRRIAADYTARRDAGGHPIAEITRQYQPIATSTVSRWVKAARERGFIEGE